MRRLFTAALLVLLADAGAVGVLADHQQDYRPPEGPTPRTPSGKVDFSGVWEKPYVPDMSQDGKGQKGHADLPFTPWGESEWKAYDAANGDYTGACLPFGMTRSMNTPEPMQFIQSDKYLGFLFEQNSWFTVVPIDGRAHRKGEATWFGDSVGHWEGDTLVVDTTNFVEETWFGEDGYFHSDAMHVIERLWRVGENLAYQVTVDDPKVLTQPWTNFTHLIRPSDQPLEESPACKEDDAHRLLNLDHHLQR
jgi:hypothetical protein